MRPFFDMEPVKLVAANWKNTDNGFAKEKTKSQTELSYNTEPAVEEVDERGKWGSRAEFLLSCIGYSVGFGNLVRFPYLCMRNGGGAFLIPYFFFLFVCALPLFYLEVVIGQYSSLSALQVWKLAPLFKGIGWANLIMSGMIGFYYNILIAYALYYLGMSFTDPLPWSGCNNTWNTPDCFQPGVDIINNSLSSTNVSQAVRRTASEEFWEYNVLEISSGIDEIGGLRWELVLCFLAAWLVVFVGLCRGVQSLGKVVYVTATFPYIVLTILLIRGALLPGAVEGIQFYITPDFDRLSQLSTWAEACLQIFFSLGPAWGGVITMASYNKFNNDCFTDTIIICLTCCFTSLFAGFTVFAVVGYMAHEMQVNISDVITSGPGLAYVAYPQAIAMLPLSPLWAVLFFLMLLTLGIDSQFVSLETVTSGIIDSFPQYLRAKKTLVISLTCALMFCGGLLFTTRAGIYIYTLMDWYMGVFTIFVVAILEAVIISWIYGFEAFYSNIEAMLGSRPSVIWKILWGGITPVLLLAIFIYNFYGLRPPSFGDYEFPQYAVGIGWGIAVISAVPIVAYMINALFRESGPLKERVKKLLTPEEDWGRSDKLSYVNGSQETVATITI